MNHSRNSTMMSVFVMRVFSNVHAGFARILHRIDIQRQMSAMKIGKDAVTKRLVKGQEIEEKTPRSIWQLLDQHVGASDVQRFFRSHVFLSQKITNYAMTPAHTKTHSKTLFFHYFFHYSLKSGKFVFYTFFNTYFAAKRRKF